MSSLTYFILLIISNLLLLIFGHVVGDFVFQSDAMAKGKNRHRQIDMGSIPPGQAPQTVWPYFLTAHAIVHGGIVTIVTGNILLGLAETVAHWIIDFGKCESWYGIHIDQLLHFVCKLLWVALLV